MTSLYRPFLSVYNTAGVQLLKIEHYVVPKRTLYMPHPASHFPWVDQEYDARGRPTKWEWGGKKDIIRYDQQVKMEV
jgi:hypothetical protein